MPTHAIEPRLYYVLPRIRSVMSIVAGVPILFLPDIQSIILIASE